MNVGKLLFKPGGVGFASGAILMLLLTSCVNHDVNRPAQGSVYEEPPPIYVAPAKVYAMPSTAPAAQPVVQDDYIYYPNYQVYYSSRQHQFAYREGNAWVLWPTPPGVTVGVLQASPSVKMDFHDSPENHHAAVVQKYPKNWLAPGSNQGQKTALNDYPSNSGK
jgi:hypothetical protein